MKKSLLVGIACLLILPAFGQSTGPDSAEIESMNEILISAQRMGDKRLNNTRQIEAINAKQIAMAQQGTMADVLAQTGYVFMQKSQLGGGSPVLRGFEASRVLMVVDGVRMNNATYRAGHLQDLITLDQFMLDRTEIFFGSGSTLYGSDALGGVIYLKSRDPKFREHKFGFANANANLRYMSAANASIANINFEVSGRKLAWLFNITHSDFGDLRMGQQRNFTGNDTFGYRNYYIDRINGRDTQLRNYDPFVQKGSGYVQNDLFSKLALKTGKLTHMLNVQLSTTDVVPRYDRLTDVRNGALRFATWNYAPQNRRFISYALNLPSTDRLKHRVILSNQFAEVGRVTRSFKATNEKAQVDKVMMSAFNYDIAYRLLENLKIQGGAEFVANDVKSTATNTNVNTGAVTSITDTRYADGGAKTSSMSVFANANYAILPDDFIVEAGFRASNYNLKANYTAQNFLKLPYSEATVKNSNLVYNLGVIKNLGIKGLFMKASLASGFRNPNVDDMTKLFESAAGNKLIFPNKDLKAEQTRSIDLNISYTNENTRFEAGTYYTKIDNLLIDQTSTFNGADSFFYDGKMTRVYQMANTAGGYVTGSWFAAKLRVIENLFADFNYTTTYGRYKATEKSAWAPLDHVAPDHGRGGLRWVSNEWQLEAFVLFQGWKKAKDYSPSGEDNAQYSDRGRTPSWQTYNIRGQWIVNKHLQVGFAVENILDLRYRVFASGISAPGRNFVLSLKGSF